MFWIQHAGIKKENSDFTSVFPSVHLFFHSSHFSVTTLQCYNTSVLQIIFVPVIQDNENKWYDEKESCETSMDPRANPYEPLGKP